MACPSTRLQVLEFGIACRVTFLHTHESRFLFPTLQRPWDISLIRLSKYMW